MKFIKILVTILLIGFIGLIIYWISLDNPPVWTGFGESYKKPNIEPAKTLFDWLRILILPLSLGLLSWLYKEDEKTKERKKEKSKNEKEAYSKFVDGITELIKNHGLTSNLPSASTRAIAFKKLCLTLEEVDESVKGQIIQFLYQSNLIDSAPKFVLVGAEFGKTKLDNIILVDSEIKSAYFQNSSIKNAKLNNACFDSCNFENSDFTESHVNNTDLSYTNLKGSKLREMDLTTVIFEGADLTNADLSGSTIRREQLESIHNKNGIKTYKTNII